MKKYESDISILKGNANALRTELELKEEEYGKQIDSLNKQLDNLRLGIIRDEESNASDNKASPSKKNSAQKLSKKDAIIVGKKRITIPSHEASDIYAMIETDEEPLNEDSKADDSKVNQNNTTLVSIKSDGRTIQKTPQFNTVSIQTDVDNESARIEKEIQQQREKIRNEHDTEMRRLLNRLNDQLETTKLEKSDIEKQLISILDELKQYQLANIEVSKKYDQQLISLHEQIKNIQVTFIHFIPDYNYVRFLHIFLFEG